MLAPKRRQRHALAGRRQHDELTAYPRRSKKSWLYERGATRRATQAWFKKGQDGRQADDRHRAVAAAKLGVNAAWTHAPRQARPRFSRPPRLPAKDRLPKPDGKLSFDRLAVFVSNTNHEEEPAGAPDAEGRCHASRWRINLAQFTPAGAATARPACTSSCQNADGGDRLQINAQNCVHCKTCDIICRASARPAACALSANSGWASQS